jgi:hypothetical protein
MSKMIFPQGVTHIPQHDLNVNFNQNGGVMASQSFLAKKSDLVVNSTLSRLFTQGNLLGNIDPNCPAPYRNLKLVSFVPQDFAPGVISIPCEFSGYEFGNSGGTSSGSTPVIETYSLRGSLEEAHITYHKKFQELSDTDKTRIGYQLAGKASLYSGDLGEWVPLKLPSKIPPIDTEEVPDVLVFKPFRDKENNKWSLTGDALKFATMIDEGNLSFKSPSYTWIVRTEGELGFTSAQLNSIGKFTNPPGPAPKPNNGWDWMLISPDQEQVGVGRYIKDLTFQLVRKDEKTDFLYT